MCCPKQAALCWWLLWRCPKQAASLMLLWRYPEQAPSLGSLGLPEQAPTMLLLSSAEQPLGEIPLAAQRAAGGPGLLGTHLAPVTPAVAAHLVAAP